MGIEQIAFFCFNSFVASLFVFGMLFIVSGIVHEFLGHDSLSVRWSAIIVIGLWLASVGFQILAVLGLFRVWAVATAMVCAVGILALKGYSLRTFFSGLHDDRIQIEKFLLLETNPLQKCLLGILGIGALLVASRALILPPLSSDTLTYHAVKAGMWVQSGHIGLMEAPGGWFIYRNFPGGGEILQALSMLPFENDFVLGLVDFVEWLALIPALFLLGRCVGLERISSFVASLFCLFLPCVFFSVGSSFVDLLMALTLILGVVFTAKYCLCHRKQYLVLGLMSLGLAGGVKYFAYAPIVGVLMVVGLHITLHKQLRVENLLIFGLAIMMMLIPMVPWLFYNVPTNGHSSFPISLEVAGLKLSPNNPVADWFFYRPDLIPYDLKQEAITFRRFFSWPWHNQSGYNNGWNVPNFGMLSLLPFCLFPFAMVSITRQQVWIGLLIAAFVGSIIGCFYLPGFTVIRQGWAGTNARFLLGAFFSVVVISALFFKGGIRERYLDFLLVGAILNFIVVIRLEWQQFELPYAVFACVLLASVVLFVCFSARRLPIAQYAVGVIFLPFICWSVLFLVRDNIRPDAIARSYFIDPFPRYWIETVKWVEEPERQRRIAVTSGPQQWIDNWYMYLFLGKSLQNIIYYVPVTESGKIQHFGPWAVEWEQFCYASWLKRLHRQGITHVMSFLPSSIEIRWMIKHPESFEQITGNDHFGLFLVKGTSTQFPFTDFKDDGP